jgi:hypothetical protein
LGFCQRFIVIKASGAPLKILEMEIVEFKPQPQRVIVQSKRLSKNQKRRSKQKAVATITQGRRVVPIPRRSFKNQTDLAAAQAQGVGKVFPSKVKQNVLAQNFKSQNSFEKLNEFEKIIMSITNPAAFPPKRLVDSSNKQPTALAAPWTILDVPDNLLSGDIPLGESLIFLFKDMERGYIYYDRNSTGLSYNYAMYQASLPTLAYQIPSATSIETFNIAGQFYPMQFAYGKPTVTYQPHGTTWFGGSPNEERTGDSRRFFFLSVGDTWSVTSNFANAVTFKLSWDYWTPQSLTLDHITTTIVGTGASATAFVTIVDEGYYALKMNSTSAPLTITMTSNIAGNGPVWCHNAVPGYDVNAGVTEGTRINAMSVLYSNRASDLNMQGEIVGYQAPQGTHWTDFLGSFRAIARSTGSKTHMAKKGAYVWARSCGVQDHKFRRYIDLDNAGNILDSYYPLQPTTDFILLAASIAQDSGRDAIWTLNYGIEYKTRDTWRVIDSPRCNRELYQRAIDFTSDIPQVLENPNHLKTIWGIVQKNAANMIRGVVDYGIKSFLTPD